jgi:KDO2-lipid IV(A) lauroyltransferase
MLTAVAGRLPLSVNRFLGRLLGTTAFHVPRRERTKALDNIRNAFPEWPEAEHRRVIKSMYRHLATSVFEVLWVRHASSAERDALTRFEGLDRIKELIAAGRTVVVFTAHCGNWEWLAFLVGVSLGPNVSVLHRDRNEPELNRFIVETRAMAGVQSIGRGSTSAGRELIQAIRRGGILAFLIDQNIRTESVKVPFFGRPALTPIGPAKLAIRSEAVVAFAFIERRNGIHHIVFQEPRETRKGDDPVKLTEEMTAAIEAQIRRAPEQWVWLHDRWRERPKWDVSEG